MSGRASEHAEWRLPWQYRSSSQLSLSSSLDRYGTETTSVRGKTSCNSSLGSILLRIARLSIMRAIGRRPTSNPFEGLQDNEKDARREVRQQAAPSHADGDAGGCDQGGEGAGLNAGKRKSTEAGGTEFMEKEGNRGSGSGWHSSLRFSLAGGGHPRTTPRKAIAGLNGAPVIHPNVSV